LIHCLPTGFGHPLRNRGAESIRILLAHKILGVHYPATRNMSFRQVDDGMDQ